jgi:phospholipid/cholesterol/gamma-HCH transport system substrate-binding protein
MEFNARYALTGVFMLAVAAAVVVFLYWLNNSAGFGEREQLRIRFTVPVSGMASGGNVLFNGIKVGEITAIRFDDARPESLLADVSIIRGLPLRTDTLIGIDYQGLTGAANILMTGGSPDAPRPQAGANGMALLEADPSASRSWMQNAGRVLGRLDDLLGRNDDRFDSILKGLERMAGGGSEEEGKITYDLPVPADFPPPRSERSWSQLAIAEPTVALAQNTDKLLVAAAETGFRPLGDARWSDNLPNLFQLKLVQAFENAGYADSVLRPLDAVDPDFRLAIDIRSFEMDGRQPASAVLDFTARLIDRDGAVRETKRFTLSQPAADDSEQAAVDAFGAVFGEAARELIAWSLAGMG